MKSGSGRGRQGPGILRSTARTGPVPGTTGQRLEPLAGQQHVDTRQLRWLPRHQPWNAPAGPVRSSGRSIDALSAQLDELSELREAGLLTDDEFVSQRAWLLALPPSAARTEPPPPRSR